MKITESTSELPQTCWRCKTLGLPDNGIAANEPHFVIENEGLEDRCCADCMVRLQEDIQP